MISNKKLSLLVLSILLGLNFGSAQADPKAVKPTSLEYVISENSPQYANLKIETLNEIAAPATAALNGKITFDENFTTRISSPVLGRAIKINVQIGDQVKSGQALASIDSPDLGTAVAEYRKAHADLELKRKGLERSKLLLEGGVIAQKEFDFSQSEFSQSEAEAQRTKSRLHNLNIDVSRLSGSENFALKSPISGIVVDRQINPGIEVRPDANAPLFTITNPSHLWATIDLPERDLNKVFIGQLLNIEVDAFPNEHFAGKVQSIGTVVDSNSRRIQVRCTVESKNKLKPEMYARITPLSAGKAKVIRLPNSALITEGLYNYVFVETKPGHIQKRKVSLDVQEHDYSTVKEGLHAGEHVITSGAILINSELAAGK